MALTTPSGFPYVEPADAITDYPALSHTLADAIEARAKFSPWHEIGAAGEPPFISPWSNFAPATEETLAFRKEGGDVIRLKGVIKSTTPASNICVLPAGYRPKRVVRFICASAATGIVDRVEVLPDGSVNCPTATAARGYLDLSQVAFAIVP